jgi:hypothetical protein
VEKMLDIREHIKELKASLKLYKESLGPERYKVKESARVPVAVGQIRNLFWSPNEYVLIYHIEDSGLVHAVPLTVWVSLTTCSIKIHLPIRDFLKLVWKRYEDITLSSLFYTHNLREGKHDKTS